MSIFVCVYSTNSLLDKMHAYKLGYLLQRAGMNNTHVYDGDESLGKQLKEAQSKGYTYALIRGPQELDNDTVAVKDLTDQTNYIVPINGTITTLGLISFMITMGG